MHAAIVRRAIGAGALALVGWQIGSIAGDGAQQPRNALIGLGVGACLGATAAPLFVTRPYQSLRFQVSRVPPQDLIVGSLGLILGLIVAALLSYPLSFLPLWFGHVLPAVAAAICAYLGATLFLMRRRELGALLPHRTPDHPSATAYDHAGCLLDTSAIIDGRIADVSQTGFLSGPLVVPRFVLAELQHIAGSSDALRRNRGRRGLEILSRMQKESIVPIKVADIEVREVPDVDAKLVKLAKQWECPVITNDFNLNRVAALQGVRVLNINELANAIKPVVLPGEEMAVHIIQEGKEVNQGVAYLDDGTMIVVENARRYMHSDVQVVVTRVLQTMAGRMIFAHPKSNGHE